jgi:hypothetical protein
LLQINDLRIAAASDATSEQTRSSGVETAQAGTGQNSKTHVSIGDAGRRLAAGRIGTFENSIRLAHGFDT